MGDGKQWMPWIHIADEIAALKFLLEQDGASGAFNLNAPEPVTNGEMGRTMGSVLRRPSLLRAPAFALRALLGEMSELVLDGQRAIPVRLLELGFAFRFTTARPALEDLLR
jgi:NAD dependent epimerase/dehydratase family enzyme